MPSYGKNVYENRPFPLRLLDYPRFHLLLEVFLLRKHVDISKGYVNYYEQTAFLQKNSKFLNQYQILMQELDSDMNGLMHKMWIGDRKFLGDECKMEVEY